MKNHLSGAKATRKSGDSPPQDSSAAGNEAIALAPPAYGIEFVDGGMPATAPSPIQRVAAPEPEKEVQEEKKIGQAKFASAPSAMPQSSPGGISTRSVLDLQRAVGNQAVLQLFRSRAIQAKLAIDQPGDAYEQEADRIADEVLATPPHPAVSGGPPRIQRFAGQPTGQMEAAPASVDQALASPGSPLEPALRQDMEQRFGYDFSRVQGAFGRSRRTIGAGRECLCLHGWTQYGVWCWSLQPTKHRRPQASDA